MRKSGWVLVAAAAGGAGWAVAELARPRRVDIREFDPDEVARLETAMWRSYYDRRRLPLFGQLVALLQGQFHLQPLRAVTLAGLAARAAAVFQVGATHADYRRALPYLERYYAGIRAVSEVPFDPWRAAELELEWWIVHREADDHPPGDLEAALADLAAELYQVPAERCWAHATRRAEAMTIRDRTSRREVGVTGDDWDRIEAVLWVSWKALADEVRVTRDEEASQQA
ncbi:MAG TPA: hypothetical protein VF468_04050 [Actinomycetota bacterium]|nr:hypothetical protein [Actinomycetota bacterium]